MTTTTAPTIARTDRPRPGTAGAAWALAYVPLHVFWALGGSVAAFGLADPGRDWAVSNWAASVVLVGAALTCLALTRPWGAALPTRACTGVARVGGAIALAHWALFTVTMGLGAAGVVDTGASRGWLWWNLLVFEPWFAVMGVLLLRCARRPVPARADAPRAGTAVLLAGVAGVVAGVVLFQPWLFLGVGPAAVLAGAALLARRERAPWTPLRRWSVLAAAWAAVFATPHVFWAAGVQTGLKTALSADVVDHGGAVLRLANAGIAAFCLCGALVAWDAGHARRLPRGLSLGLAWFGAVLLVGRAVDIFVEFGARLSGLLPLPAAERPEYLHLSRWFLFAYLPWFALGGVLWTALALRRTRRSVGACSYR